MWNHRPRRHYIRLSSAPRVYFFILVGSKRGTSEAYRPGRAIMRHAGQTLRNLCDRTQRCPRVRARSAGLVESARSRTRENSSAELIRRGWLSARRAGVQTTISGATGREADDKAARGAPKHVGGQEAIPPVRCAPPSPLHRPLSRISRLFHSFRPSARVPASLSRSTRALLTSLAQGRKSPRTSSSTPQPRAPPASDVAGGSGEVGS